jgi:hypothetical protein
VLVSLGRSYIKVQCGAQFGWLDVRDNLIIVDVGTKVGKGRMEKGGTGWEQATRRRQRGMRGREHECEQGKGGEGYVCVWGGAKCLNNS